jgi:hypothetical protein
MPDPDPTADLADERQYDESFSQESEPVAGGASAAPGPVRSARSTDDLNDSESLHLAPETGEPIALDHGQIDWATETNPQRIGGELRRIEAEVRRLLGARDPKRKRKMAGTRRWIELEEDIISWKFTDRFDEEILRRLSELITKRHHLYARLRFLAFTRPTWNS